MFKEGVLGFKGAFLFVILEVSEIHSEVFGLG